MRGKRSRVDGGPASPFDNRARTMRKIALRSENLTNPVDGVDLCASSENRFKEKFRSSKSTFNLNGLFKDGFTRISSASVSGLFVTVSVTNADKCELLFQTGKRYVSPLILTPLNGSLAVQDFSQRLI